MSVKSRTHLESLRSHFELLCLLAMIVIAADIAWAVRDAMANNWSIFYWFLIFFLLIGEIGTGYVVWQHHARFVKSLRKTLLSDKLKTNRHKLHHKREQKPTRMKK